ncbi:hypothetical protein [Amycolatopsis granulosa]|nr:hypothetical protein [Amycolatopsis granulosa]NIH85150.1 hypothetical protein [Amycolatopsis granulosa]
MGLPTSVGGMHLRIAEEGDHPAHDYEGPGEDRVCFAKALPE